MTLLIIFSSFNYYSLLAIPLITIPFILVNSMDLVAILLITASKFYHFGTKEFFCSNRTLERKLPLQQTLLCFYHIHTSYSYPQRCDVLN